MSLVPVSETVKNTIEVLNNIYKMSGPDLQWATFLKFCSKISFDWFFYLVGFQWINDFVRIPIIVPQIAESIFSEIPHSYLSFFPIEPSKNFFGTSFFSGFFNCFFLYFPVSSVHFIWLRYVLLDGQKSSWAGRAATLGLIFGNLSLFGFCLFGCRSIINIWFGLEPFSYFFGVWLVLKVIFELTNRPSLIRTRYRAKQLWKIFFINFGCVWADQSGFYQFFGNLSVQSGFSLLDFVHSSLTIYFLGIILGSWVWTFLISQALLHAGYLFPKITKYNYSYWIRGFNAFCLIGCVTLTLTSFAFYGTDYLFLNPLGFLPQDQALELISLSAQTKDTSQGRLGEKSSYGSVDTDLSLFDQGRYAGGPVVEFHIESLNYREEYAWRTRIDRYSSRGLNRGGGILDQYITTQLGPVDQAFQKQRKHKKRTQQIRTLKKKDLKKKMQLENTISLDFEDDILDYISDYGSLVSKQNLKEYYGQLIERYIEDYTAEANLEDVEIPDLSEEKMIRYSAFSEIAKYGFDAFSMIDTIELDPFDEELTRDLKERFSENLINKYLVHFDILNFIKRQPKFHKLTSKEEISLFQKRLVLAEYFDTFRGYFDLPDKFQPLFCGPKSYVNRIYNQQFKGTLKIVERLFSIHLKEEKKPPIKAKSESSNQKNKKSELARKKQNKQRKENEYKEIDKIFSYNSNIDNLDFLEAEYLKLKEQQKESSVLKFDQPLYKTKFLKQNPLIHEQFIDQMPSLIYEADVQPFLKEGSSYPFFVGWDNEQRKFIVTNRLLTQKNILSKVSIPKDINYRKFSSTTQKTNSNPTFTFTTWPVTSQSLKNSPFFSRLFNTYEEMASSAEDIFKYAEPQMEEDTIIYKQLPNIVRRINFELKDQPNLAPKRGGLIWPGNELLKYKFQFKASIIKLLKHWGFF